MAYMDDLLRELEARNLTGKIYNAGSSSSQSSNSTQKKKKKDYTEELLTILSEDAKKNGVKLELSDYGTISADSFKAPMDDIAPVKTTVKKSEEADDGLLDFFQKGAFSDGYQAGDLTKTILGTLGDGGLEIVRGAGSLVEGVTDAASYGGAYIAEKLGHKAYADQVRRTASENTIEQWTKKLDNRFEQYSVLGRTSDAILQGVGQVGGILATGGIAGAVGASSAVATAATTGVMGVSGFGSGAGEAYRAGASDKEAMTYGLIAGASDALTELLFGGLGKAVGAVGLSTGLSSADDLLAKKVSGLFTNQIAKNFAEYGIKAGAEGFEEVLAGTAQAIGKKITYMKEEELSEILKDENLLEQFVVGAAASGLMQSGMIPGTSEGSLREANAQGRDFITGLNQNEQTVIDKEVEKRVAAQEKDGKTLTKKERTAIEKQVLEDLDRGGIDIDTIEEVLGGETYTNYKKLADAEAKMQTEYDELGKKEKYTLADDARYKELGERLKYVREKGAKNELRKRLDEQVSSMVKDSRLSESFAERSRRGQAFEADLTQYTDEKQRAIVQKAVESGVLNNTNRTREFVNMVSKIAADKDISFDFANNAKLKETGFAVEGKTVNGFVTKDGITVNIQSAKALNSVVGHEITHVLEGTELYTELQTAAIEYAKAKGDYQGRYDALVKLYESVEGADIDAELTADLVGDYLFTDSDFINNLSANHRNVFQKIYDEVKYLLKVATAGSKEARELEKVKRAFEKAYREGGKASDSTKYKLAKDADGKVFVDVTEDIFDANNGESVARTIQRVIAERFNNMIEANGQKFQINKKTNDEFRRSNSANALLKNSPQAYNDKLRVIANADEILTAAKNWIGEEAGHSRKDDIVEFGRGNVMYRVGENGYVADVIVGIRKNGSAILYDLVNVYETEIAEAPVTMASHDNSQRRQDASADENVAQNGGEVKTQYSLSSDSEGRQLSAEQREYFKDSKIVDENGNLKVVYHGTPNGDFTVFRDGSYFTDNREYAERYQSPSASSISTGKSATAPKVFEVYLDIKKPFDLSDAEAKRIYIEEYIKGGNAMGINPYLSDAEYAKIETIDWTEGEDLRDFLTENDYDYDGLVLDEGADGGYGEDVQYRGKSYVVFNSEQVKSVDNTKPTADPDIRYSLSEYSEEEKKAHNAAALEHFGKTYRWAETGYLLLDGARLDLSGKRFGAPGGYRTVDHRDIADALGADYGDGSYSGALMQFMSEGNIRISPESNGINLSVLPTKAQESSLSAFISSVRGEVLLDIDDYEGDTVLSIEYPKYTHANKVLADIRAWFESGATPEVEGGSVFRRSLSAVGEERYAFGNYNVYGRDIALEEAIAPVRQDIAPATVSKNATVAQATVDAPAQTEEDIAPMPQQPGERVTDEEVAAAQAAWDSVDAKQREYDELVDEYEELERQVYEAYEIGDNETATDLNADLMDAAARFSQLKQQIEEETDAFEQMHGAVYANEQERLASFGDADAPAMREAPYQESTDNVTLPDKRRNNLAAEVRKVLGFSTKRVAEMRQLIDKFAANEIDGDDLYAEIKLRFGAITEKTRQEDVAEVKKWLKGARINVSDEIKSNFADYEASVRRPNAFKITFAKDGADVDLIYEELKDLFPGFFPADIINPADQLERIIEVANESINTEMQYEIDERMLDDVTDNIIMQVNEYRQEQRRLAAQANSAAARNSLLAYADRYAPAEDGDIGPVRADVANTTDGDMGPVRADVGATSQQESADGFVPDKPIRTIPERLEAELQSYQTELQNVKRLREEAKDRMQQDIAKKQAEYDSRKNKNTQEAQKNLQSVQRLIGQASRIDAKYSKRVSDLEAKVAKAAEAVRDGESKEAQGAMRRELQAAYMEEISSGMAERGFDIDEVLKNAKDLPTIATVDNTPQRVMEKALGYKAGQALADLTINRQMQHTTEGTKWLNTITGKNGLLEQLSKQYSIKPGSKESKAAQMYAEGYFVDGNKEKVAYGDRELAQDFPDAKVQANIKGLARDPRIRQFYDETLARINDSRTRNAYPAIKPLENYFLHFHAMEDIFSKIGIPFNPNDIAAKDLPTDMNGMTADLKPGQPYFASANHRRGIDTTFDLLGGLERYAKSAMPQMYYIDDIQRTRALRNYIADSFGQAKGLEALDTMSDEEAREHLKKVYDSHLSTFALFLNEQANVYAGKTALIDRGLEGVFGRRGIAAVTTLNRMVGANMVGFNVSSALTNFIAPVQAFAKTNKAAFVKGFAQTVANRVGSIVGKTDGFAENNPTMIRREGAANFYRTPWQKAGDLGYALMGGIDSFSTEIIVRSKYNELVSKGMSAEQAVIEADKWASRLMGDRSLGQQPQIFNSKTLGIFTKFQLEVRNQLDAMFYDTIQEAKVSNEDIQNGLKRNAKTAAQVTSTIVQLAVVQHLFGKAFEAVAGYNPAFDIIEAIVKAFGWDDEEESEDTVLDNLGQSFMSLLEDMPYSSVAAGGRIPISSALPITQLIKGKDKYGNEKSRWETIAETAPYYLLPGGYGQIKKTAQGLNMFDEDLPIAGSYTDSGNLRYPVEDTLGSRVQAAIFGQYASSNARDYFDNERQSLKKNQIQELVDVDIPIREYWDYREGLNEQETLAEKFDYIAGLDLPIDKKNILINNVVDRKEAVDLTDYDDYADYEEFDFAVKNPEKYDFLQSVGVSVGEYNSFDDDTKDAYNWAYQNPEKYTLSRAVSDDVAVYRQYTKALNDISADKDADGKSISGSRKAKVIDYLNNLDADYYAKLILFKMEYNADDTYNNEIIEYLNGRNDISFEEEVTILRELGFTVTADGTVRW